MSDRVTGALAPTIANVHRQLLNVTASSTDAHVAWSPGALAPSISFHRWHVARGADQHRALAEELGQRLGPREGLWRALGLDDPFLVPCPAFTGGVTTIGTLIVEYLAHAARHLGVIGCLRGVQGLRGTASR